MTAEQIVNVEVITVGVAALRVIGNVSPIGDSYLCGEDIADLPRALILEEGTRGIVPQRVRRL